MVYNAKSFRVEYQWQYRSVSFPSERFQPLTLSVSVEEKERVPSGLERPQPSLSQEKEKDKADTSSSITKIRSREPSIQVLESNIRTTYSVPSDIDTDSESDCEEIQELSQSEIMETALDSNITTPEHNESQTTAEKADETESANDKLKPSGLNLKGPSLSQVLSDTATRGSSQVYPINIETDEPRADDNSDNSSDSDDQGPDVLPAPSSKKRSDIANLLNERLPSESVADGSIDEDSEDEATSSANRQDAQMIDEDFPVDMEEAQDFGLPSVWDGVAQAPATQYTGIHQSPYPGVAVPTLATFGPYHSHRGPVNYPSSNTVSSNALPSGPFGFGRNPAAIPDWSQERFNERRSFTTFASPLPRPDHNPHAEPFYQDQGIIDPTNLNPRSNEVLAQRNASQNIMEVYQRALTTPERIHPQDPTTFVEQAFKPNISNLIHSQSVSEKPTLKRKAEEISSGEQSTAPPLGNDVRTTEDSSEALQDAQPREAPVLVETETSTSQGESSNINMSSAVATVTTGIIPAVEEPPRKKVKTSKNFSGIGKFVSGVCLGIVGAAAAFVATIPASVHEEALREMA